MSTVAYFGFAHAHREPLAMAVNIYLGHDHAGKRVIQELTMTDREVEPGERVSPSLALDESQAQMLFQDLWDAGFRPHSGEASVAHVEAMHGTIKAKDAHLADLRGILQRVLPGKDNNELEKIAKEAGTW